MPLPIEWIRPLRKRWMSKKEYRKVPGLIKMRLSDIVITKPGSRSDGFTVATALLDAEVYPNAWIGSLHNGRWMVEPHIGSIKCTWGLSICVGQVLRHLGVKSGRQC